MQMMPQKSKGNNNNTFHDLITQIEEKKYRHSCILHIIPSNTTYKKENTKRFKGKAFMDDKQEAYTILYSKVEKREREIRLTR